MKNGLAGRNQCSSFGRCVGFVGNTGELGVALVPSWASCILQHLFVILSGARRGLVKNHDDPRSEPRRHVAAGSRTYAS